MTNKTTREQAIEKIALFFLYPVGDTEKTGFDCEEWNYAYDIAQKLDIKLESLGYVQLDEDQSLPKINSEEPLDSKYNYKYWAYGDICKEAQQDMLEDNFAKVKKE